MNEPAPTAKILFRVSDDDGGAHVETLWAYDLGDDCYRLANSPFFAYSVSWEDVVFAPFDSAEGFPTFVRVVSKSGNRTVRISFDVPVEEGNASDHVLQELSAAGCSPEGFDSQYIAVNVPPEILLEEVARFLNECDVAWEYADPTEEELLGEVTGNDFS